MPLKPNHPHYIAQSILARRDHSVFELKTKMEKRGIPAHEIKEIINKLKKLKLLDDKKFAQKYTQQIIQIKPVGPRLIKQKLRQKKINDHFIQAALDTFLTEDLEKELAQKAARKWQQLHPQKKSDRIRLTRFLTSRGFSYSTVKTVTRELTNTA